MIWRFCKASGIPGLIVVAVLVLAIACGPAATPTPTSAPPTPTPTPTTAAPAIATPTATAAAVATPTARPTPTATAAPATTQPKATLKVAALEVLELPGMPFDAAYGGQWTVNGVGISEMLFVGEGDSLMTPHLGTSFEFSSDLKKVTIKVRPGIPWVAPVGVDKNFGEFSAEDAVWFLNKANAAINKDSTHKFAGTLAGNVGEAKLVDKYTFEIYGPQGGTLDLISIQDVLSEVMHGSEMFSKRVYDEMGAEWMKRNAVGTGPFRLAEWVTNDHGTVEAAPTHFKHPSKYVKRFTLVHVPEGVSRVAMLKSGEVDAASIPVVFAPELIKAGFKYISPMGLLTTASWGFQGNLWEEKHAVTGEPLEPWKSPVYAKDYPWIGNPWGDKVPYTDTDNPPGMSDMEQARLVRQALSYAIDRDGLIEKAFGGIGKPIPVEYVGPDFPSWQPKRTITRKGLDEVLAGYGWTSFPTYGVKGPYDDFAWVWEAKYDPKFAEGLLEKAGYPKGANGVRFDLTLSNYRAGEVGGVAYEAGDAIAAMYEEIGVKTTLSREDYGAVVSPRMRKREQIWPVLKNCDVEESAYPPDWPFPVSDTSITRPGWGCGFEDPFLAQMVFKIKREPDRQKRITMHDQVLDWMIYWRLYAGVVELPTDAYAIDPKKIKEWTSRPRTFGASDIWNIVTVSQ